MRTAQQRKAPPFHFYFFVHLHPQFVQTHLSHLVALKILHPPVEIRIKIIEFVLCSTLCQKFPFPTPSRLACPPFTTTYGHLDTFWTCHVAHNDDPAQKLRRPHVSFPSYGPNFVFGCLTGRRKHSTLRCPHAKISLPACFILNLWPDLCPCWQTRRRADLTLATGRRLRDYLHEEFRSPSICLQPHGTGFAPSAS